jgi:hypothetical protein
MKDKNVEKMENMHRKRQGGQARGAGISQEFCCIQPSREKPVFVRFGLFVLFW